MELQLTTRHEGDVAIVGAQGEVDVFTAPGLDAELEGQPEVRATLIQAIGNYIEVITTDAGFGKTARCGPSDQLIFSRVSGLFTMRWASSSRAVGARFSTAGVGAAGASSAATEAAAGSADGSTAGSADGSAGGAAAAGCSGSSATAASGIGSTSASGSGSARRT